MPLFKFVFARFYHVSDCNIQTNRVFRGIPELWRPKDHHVKEKQRVHALQFFYHWYLLFSQFDTFQYSSISWCLSLIGNNNKNFNDSSKPCNKVNNTSIKCHTEKNVLFAFTIILTLPHIFISTCSKKSLL